MNKRGFFFTLSALLVISLFLLGYTLYQSSQERRSTQQRVETLNSFLFSTEQDLGRQLYIVSFRIIFLLEDQITKTGAYATNIDGAFAEGVMNGTLYGQPQTLLDQATFPYMKSTIATRANMIGANVTLTQPLVNVTQVDPWHVKVTLTMQIYLKDQEGLASWNKTETIETLVPIENFEDPLYLINTDGLVTNQFRKTPYAPLVQETNVTNLTAHLLGSYYLSSTLAPSFLQRLQGQTGANSQGIESLVNLNQLSLKGVVVQDKTLVDYLYFSVQSPPIYGVQGMPSWFKIDNSSDRLALYGVSNITI